MLKTLGGFGELHRHRFSMIPSPLTTSATELTILTQRIWTGKIGSGTAARIPTKIVIASPLLTGKIEPKVLMAVSSLPFLEQTGAITAPV